MRAAPSRLCPEVPIDQGSEISIHRNWPEGQGRRQSVRVVDPNLETKRRRVITEFCETEKSYVDGLELIHSVSVDLM